MSVTAAKGFEASGVAAGIRREGKDLALVRATTRATGAAVWTRNRVQAAPLPRLSIAQTTIVVDVAWSENTPISAVSVP